MLDTEPPGRPGAAAVSAPGGTGHPLDELLLQLAESLRKTMALAAAEVWTAGDGIYERAVSVPGWGQARLTVGPQGQGRGAGPAWLRLWLPALLSGREDGGVWVAPVTNSGDPVG